MEKGFRFTATDKLGRTYTYKYIKDTQNYPYNHLILNEDTQSESTVEQEWFEQRIIKAVR